MITDRGKAYMLESMARNEHSIGDYIGLGIGDSAESSASSRLDLEISRTEISSRTFNVNNNTIYLTAEIADEFVGSINEVGLFSDQLQDFIIIHPEDYPDFNDGLNEQISFEPGNRLGGNSLHLEGEQEIQSFADLDFPNVVAVAYSVDSANSLELRLGTNNTNYYSYTLSTTAGYHTERLDKGQMSTVGNPNVETINYIGLISNGTVTLDGVVLNTQSDFVIVARELLDPPVEILAGEKRNIQIAIELEMV